MGKAGKACKSSKKKKSRKKAGKGSKQSGIATELLNPPSTLELGQTLTLSDVYRDYLHREMLANKCRKCTIRDLERHLRRWNEWLSVAVDGVAIPVAKIRRRHLEVFREWMQANGRSATDCNSHIGTIRQLLNCAVRHELIQSAPALRALHARSVAAKAFPGDEQTDRLWDAAEGLMWPLLDDRGEPLPYPPSTIWQAWLVIMRTYGFRTQELTRFSEDYRSLAWGDIYLGDLTPNPEGSCKCEYGWYRYTPPKQEAKKPEPLTNPLTAYARAALDSIRPAVVDPTRKVFCMPISSASFYETWHGWLEAAGVSPREGSRCLRYTPKHYRKAATTLMNLHRPGIGPYIVGHAADRSGQTSVVSDKHYNSSEAAVLDCLMTAPMPSRFDSLLKK